MKGSCWGWIGSKSSQPSVELVLICFSGLVLPSAQNMSQDGCNHQQPRPGPALGKVCYYKMCHCLSADCQGGFKSSAAWCVPGGGSDRFEPPDGDIEQAQAPTGAGLSLTSCAISNMLLNFSELHFPHFEDDQGKV